MKVALCVMEIKQEKRTALEFMKKAITAAANENCDLIAFPEFALCGIDLTGIFEDDAKIALPVQSEEINKLKQTALDNHIYTAFGWLEISNDKIYDSAMLISPAGNSVLHYRRMNGGWMLPNCDPKHYFNGNNPECYDTAMGRIGFLLCGDLFQPEVVMQLKDLRPDIVLYLIARSIVIDDDAQSYWEQNEQPYYSEEIAKLQAKVLAVNLLDKEIGKGKEAFCGGAWIYDQTGKIVASKPLLQEGMLIYNL